MAPLQKLHEMLVNAVAAAAADSSMLLGCEIACGDAESRSTTAAAFFEKLEDPSFIVSIDSNEDYEGRLYLVTTIRDAILLSSILLGIPPVRISEKRKLAIIEDDDVDAFSEIVNQVIGSFNLTFKSSLPKKAHLKQQEMKKHIPSGSGSAADEPLPDGEYTHFRGNLTVSGDTLELFDLLIPEQLATLFDLQHDAVHTSEVSLADIPEAADEEADDDPVPEPEQTVLVLDDNAADRSGFCASLSATGYRPIGVPLDADLKSVFEKGPVEVVLVGMTTADDRELSICIKVSASASGKSLPIILCAPQWTRSGVLRAMKYGARDICLKPCDADELATRVSRLIAAA